MKGFGNFLTALGIVALVTAIAELAIGWKMLPTDELVIMVFIGSLVLILFGLIFRNIGRSKEMKAMQNNPQMYGQPGFVPQQPYNPQYMPQQNPNAQQQYYQPQQMNSQNTPNNQ